MKEMLNATIDAVSLGYEDHGIPTAYVHMDYGDGGHQGFGGYDLRFYGIDFITSILDVIGVREWNELPGKTCRVKRREGGFNTQITAIGHVTKDKWYTPESKK